MKEKYGWHLPVTEEEIKNAWDCGVLTVDTNVLLDLYRYHENTRDSLLQSIAAFNGRVWLSHQAATEFFRNRKKVIVSSSKGFKQAVEDISKLQQTLQNNISQLVGNRLIPAEITNQLDQSIRSAASKASAEILEIEKSFPNFLISDPILNRLLDIFDGSVGEDFPHEDKEPLAKVAEQRKTDKIPPGYMDKGKEDDRSHGDFYLWQQVLNYAKENQCPVILVTSERKEDWWEEHYGKIVGPRSELLKEISDIAGQTVLIYQTTNFIQHASERLGNHVDQSVVEEIRAIGQAREKAGQAVNVLDQTIISSDGKESYGLLEIELVRPVINFTTTGHFHPYMDAIPTLYVSILAQPDDAPDFELYASTGTNYDFNIHVRSGVKGVAMPVGRYIFDYQAIVHEEFEDNVSATSMTE